MLHKMNLKPQPFDLIYSGRKTIELRLNDEKRQNIKIGDTIVFTNTSDTTAQIYATVKNLYHFSDFAELYRCLPLDRCGYLPEELDSASSDDMNIYYTPEKQAQYGVLGIEIEVNEN